MGDIPQFRISDDPRKRISYDHRFKSLLIANIGVTILFSLARLESGLPEYWNRLGGLIFFLISVNVIVYCLFHKNGLIKLTPFEPVSFYAIFYGTYYLIPFSLILFDYRVTDLHFVRTGVAILLGFLSYWWGCETARSRAPAKAFRLRPTEAQALLAVCWVCTALVLWFYAWRIKNGFFYSHAVSYEIGTDLTSSLMESFVSHLQLPLFLLYGWLGASRTSSAPAARSTMNAFLVLSFFLFIVSSQFRMAASVLPLGWVGNNMFKTSMIPVRNVLKMTGVILLALVIIFTIRASGANEGLEQSRNQLTDLLAGVKSGEFFDTAKISEITLGHGELGSRVRAITPLLFFNEVSDALDETSRRFGWGTSFEYELEESIPRLIWRDKPIFLSTQIFIRQQLGMTEVDSSPHPLLQFYYELGWPGIVLGYFVVGLLITVVINRVYSSLFFFLSVFIWSAMIQVETGLFLTLLVAVRAAFIVYAFWRILAFIARVATNNRTRHAIFRIWRRNRAAVLHHSVLHRRISKRRHGRAP